MEFPRIRRFVIAMSKRADVCRFSELLIISGKGFLRSFQQVVRDNIFVCIELPLGTIRVRTMPHGLPCTYDYYRCACVYVYLLYATCSTSQRDPWSCSMTKYTYATENYDNNVPTACVSYSLRTCERGKCEWDNRARSSKRKARPCRSHLRAYTREPSFKSVCARASVCGSRDYIKGGFPRPW